MKSWQRDVFVNAVWSSAELTTIERLVALCYADQADEQGCASVTYAVLRARTGIRSNDTVTRVVRSLAAASWLALREPTSQQRPTSYRLHVPGEGVHQ